jgi:rhodanese-related sulfurtransferase
MKKLCSIALAAILLSSCSNAQSGQNNLSPTAFAAKIKAAPKAVILDVRTPDEYASGHVANALNYELNGAKFAQQIASLDKSKPVFVYCLSGRRSASAANKMRADGFKMVYEMDGGMSGWRAAQLPETTK